MTDAVLETRQAFQVRPLSDLMAAEVIGLDLSKPFDAETRDAVYQAFLDYQVLAFRDQRLTKDQFQDTSSYSRPGRVVSIVFESALSASSGASFCATLCQRA